VQLRVCTSQPLAYEYLIRSDLTILHAYTSYLPSCPYVPHSLHSPTPHSKTRPSQDGRALLFVDPALARTDRGVCLAAIRQCPAMLEHVPSNWKDDKELVIEAVSQDGASLCHASVNMRGDPDVVNAALRAPEGDGRGVLGAASADLRNDKDMVLQAIARGGGDELYCASHALQNDKDVVLAAVQHTGFALQHSSVELRGDRDVVLAAVARDVSDESFLVHESAWNLQRPATMVPALSLIWFTQKPQPYSFTCHPRPLIPPLWSA
jgi:hypothetical protein